MHPNPAFRWDDAGMRAFVAAEGFGALFLPTPHGPRVAHVPIVFGADERIEFHLARANALVPHLPGAVALMVVQGAHGYVSPTWYRARPDEVPTWNYLAVEIEGTVSPLDRPALRRQIDTLAEAHEPEPQWRLDKVAPAKTDAMLDAIAGFALRPAAWRGTRKLGQNKPDAMRLAAAQAMGERPIAAAMRAVS